MDWLLLPSASFGVAAAVMASHRLREANGSSRFLIGTGWLGILFAAQRVNTAIIESIYLREMLALAMGAVLLWLAYGRPRRH